MSTRWGVTPRVSVEAECRRRGTIEVVAACVAVLRDGDVSADFAEVLAGPASHPVMEGLGGGPHGYWPRVWALRGLLYAWDDTAAGAVIASLDDSSWRVREMAAKVIARHHVGAALTRVARLENDPVPRVRAAIERAMMSIVAHEA